MGTPALLSTRKVCCGLSSPLKSIASAGYEPATLGSSGKHTNHYTTEATKRMLLPHYKYENAVFYTVLKVKCHEPLSET
jgi:hypothetical protein